MKKIILILMSLVMMLGITTTASAISLSEKEDIYRVDEFLGYSLDKEYVINWLLEDDNFIYHLHETAPEEYVTRWLELGLYATDFLGEALLGNLSAVYDMTEDYYSALKDILLSFSTDESILNTTELKTKVRMEYLNTFKNDLVSYAFSMPETADLAAYIDGVQVTSQLKGIDDLYNKFADAAMLGADQERLWELVDDYNASAKFAENLGNVSEVVKYASKGVEVARFSYDLLIELETYNTINSQMTGVLKDIYEYSTNADVKKVAGELYTKTMNSKKENLSAAVDEIYDKVGEVGGETALMLGMQIAANKLAVSNVVAYAQLGITLGNLFSDLAFGTSDIREHLTYIEATDAVSKTIAQRLESKISGYRQTFSIREGRYEERAVAAKEIILYSKLLLQTRIKGEESYYKFKSTIYESGLVDSTIGTVDELFALLGINLTTPYDKIDAWWNARCADFDTAYKVLYSYIDPVMYKDMYEIKVPKDDFVFEDDTLVAYIGNDSVVTVPYRAYAIGTGAFDAEINMNELTLRGKRIESQAIKDCMALYSLYIPKSIKTIADDAIYNCPNVTIYGYTGSAAETYAKNNNIPFVSIGTTEYDDGAYVSGDYTLSSGTLDLDGQTMYVGGDFLHTGGTLNLGSGKLVIFGDYKVSSYYKQSATGVIFAYSGYLNMTDDNGKMIVYGTFVNQSLSNNLTAGTIEIKGDFSQVQAYTGYDYSQNNFNPRENHKVILSGTGEQNISFQNPGSSYFNILEIKNTTGLIKFSPLSVRGEIIGDIISNDDININGSNFTLKNQRIISPNIRIVNNSNVTITEEVEIKGNLHNTYGQLSICGKLDLNGDYISSCEVKYNALGSSYVNSGQLYMNDGNGYFKVKGNYTETAVSNSYTDGTLEITGNFTQNRSYTGYDYKENNFSAKEKHKVILSGTGKQTVYFQTPKSSYFNILINKNPYGVVFATDYRYNELYVIYPFDFEVAEYDAEANKINVDVMVDEDLAELNGTVAISLYDENNKFIESRVRDVSELELESFDGLKDYDGKYTVKAFYWSDMSSFIPLYHSIQTQINN